MRHRSRFENPDRAARFARRMRQHRRGAPAFLGVLLVSLGVLFLLDNLGLIEVRTLIRTYWPLLLVAWGAARLLFGRGSEQLLGGFAIVGGGILLGNQLLGWGLGIWQLLWPLPIKRLCIPYSATRCAGRSLWWRGRSSARRSACSRSGGPAAACVTGGRWLCGGECSCCRCWPRST